ncbi:MAG: hypothetical protein ABI180_16440 [Microcoleus sp.]
MTLNTFGLYRQTNILADFASLARSTNGKINIRHWSFVVGCVSDELLEQQPNSHG